jgi:hypothetical protein
MLCIMAPHSTALKMSTDVFLMTHTFMYGHLGITGELVTTTRGPISASGHWFCHKFVFCHSWEAPASKVRRGTASIFGTVWAPVFISLSYLLGSHIWSEWNLSGTEDSNHSSTVSRGDQLHSSQDRQLRREHRYVVHGNILRDQRILSSMITPYNQLNIKWCFGGTCRLNLQGWTLSQAKSQHEAGSKILLCLMHEDGADMFLRNVRWCQWTAWHYIQEYITLHKHRCENQNSI